MEKTTVAVGVIVGSCVAVIAVLLALFYPWKLDKSSKSNQHHQPTGFRLINAEDVGRSHKPGIPSGQSGLGYNGRSMGGDAGRNASPDRGYGVDSDTEGVSSPQIQEFTHSRNLSPPPMYFIAVPRNHQPGHSAEV